MKRFVVIRRDGRLWGVTESGELYHLHPWDIERLGLGPKMEVWGEIFTYQESLRRAYKCDGYIYPGTVRLA